MNENTLKKVLQKDETVLWVGQPLHFSTFNSSNRKTKLFPSILIAALTLTAIVAFLLLSADPQLVPILVLLFIGFFIFILPFAEAASIRGVDYLVTNQRILCMTDERINAFLSLQKKGTPKMVSEPEGGYSLLIGSAVTCPQKSHRKKADDGDMNKEEIVTGILLFNLSKEACEQAMTALEREPLVFTPAPEPFQPQTCTA